VSEEKTVSQIEQELFLTIGPHWRVHSNDELADMSGYPAELLAIVRGGSQQQLAAYRAQKDATPEYVTESGRVLTDEEIADLSAEAERGYDVSRLKESDPP
jgi:hypothetical protein